MTASASSVAHAPRIDLDRDEDLVLLGDARGGPDELQIGLDHRRPSERDRRVALGVQPAGQLVALRGRGPLDPLDSPDRRARRTCEHETPAREPALLSLGVKQRERHDAARQHRGQPPPGTLG